jgi:predicted Rossmann fold flavoprotein
MSQSYHTIIIGGGAAGLMCAATLLERSDFSARIAIIDRNPHLWAKVIISGWGRCNVTTGYSSIKEILTKYPRGSDFLSPILKAFTPKSIYRWFEEHGVPLKVEKDIRVFPVSDDGHDVVGAFEQLFLTHHDRIDILLRTKVESVSQAVCSDGSCSGRFQVITDKQGILTCSNVVIATGGQAYRHTGSSGDGYAFAQDLWHTITDLWPSLNSFESSDMALHELSWLAFPTAQIQVCTTWQRYAGAVLLTHFGISWPLAFIMSAHTAFDQIDHEHPLSLRLRPHADHDYNWRYDRLTQQAHTQPHKQLSTIVRQEFSEKFTDYVLNQSSIAPSLQSSQLTKDQKSTIADLLGNGIPLTIIKRRPGDEFVTAGWVNLSEVSSSDCQSRICPWLYLAGEVLDIDGYTW